MELTDLQSMGKWIELERLSEDISSMTMETAQECAGFVEEELQRMVQALETGKKSDFIRLRSSLPRRMERRVYYWDHGFTRGGPSENRNTL